MAFPVPEDQNAAVYDESHYEPNVNIFIYKKQFYKNQLDKQMCPEVAPFVCAHLIGWDIDQSDELKFSERIEILNLRI